MEWVDPLAKLHQLVSRLFGAERKTEKLFHTIATILGSIGLHLRVRQASFFRNLKMFQCAVG